jgi:aspartate aminotransferase
MIKIAKRASGMTESATLKMAQMARELAAKGHDVINLSLGEPDYDTPDHIKARGIEAIQQGFTKYTPVAGNLELRKVISEKFQRDNGLGYPPEQIVVSNGAKQSFANLCFATLEEGDEVILFSPYWVSYYEIIKLAGATPICVHAEVHDHYKPTAAALEAAISTKTRMFVFSSPCNPTGTVFTGNDLEEYARVLRKWPDILIVSDEIYEYIIFGEKHVSIGSLPDMNARTATINGFSKGFSMTGWRLGYLGAPKEVAEACNKIQGQFTSGPASFTQQAGKLALETSLEPTYRMRDGFRKRRDVLLNKLKEIPLWKVNQPEGAFYVLPEVDAYFGKSYNGQKINNSDELSVFLLQEAKVALVNGIAFGAPNCIRISYSLSEEKITEAIDRIKNALAKLN